MGKDLELAAKIMDVVPAVMRLLRREIRSQAKGEMTIPQMRILAHLSRGHGTAVELAELQGVSLPAISKLIDSMVKRGFVTRTYREGNRKQIFLSLTPKGKTRFQKARHAVELNLVARLAELPPAARNTIYDGLKSLQYLIQEREVNGES